MKKVLTLGIMLIGMMSFAQTGFEVLGGIDMKPNSLMGGLRYQKEFYEVRLSGGIGYQAPLVDFFKGDIIADVQYRLDQEWSVGGGLSVWTQDFGTVSPLVVVTYRPSWSFGKVFLNYSKYYANIGVAIPLYFR